MTTDIQTASDKALRDKFIADNMLFLGPDQIGRAHV